MEAVGSSTTLVCTYKIICSVKAGESCLVVTWSSDSDMHMLSGGHICLFMILQCNRTLMNCVRMSVWVIPLMNSVCVRVCVFNAICPTSFWCYRFLTIGPFRVFCLYPCLIRSLPLSDKPSVCKDGIAWLWHTWIKIILVDLFITSCILKLVHFGNCCCPWCMYT